MVDPKKLLTLADVGRIRWCWRSKAYVVSYSDGPGKKVRSSGKGFAPPPTDHEGKPWTTQACADRITKLTLLKARRAWDHLDGADAPRYFTDETHA